MAGHAGAGKLVVRPWQEEAISLRAYLSGCLRFLVRRVSCRHGKHIQGFLEAVDRVADRRYSGYG